jgi:PAS domain S-box-containing protein
MISKQTKKKQKYQSVKDTPLPLVISVGNDFSIEFINDLALPLLKQSAEGKIGRGLDYVFPDIFTEDVLTDLHQKCLVKKRPVVLKGKQIVYLLAGKRVASSFDITNNPLYDDKGSVMGVVTYFVDVSNKVVSGKSLEQREHYLENFFKQAPVGIVCYRGPEFRVDLANDKALEMWGKKIEEVKGKAVYEIFPEVLSDPEINKRHKESQERLKNGETHVVNEVQLTFVRNGQPTPGWYSYIHEPYTNASGEIIGMMAIAIEVTDQVLSRKKLQLVTDALPSLISYVSRDRRYEFVNKAYETWFGRPSDDVIGKTIPEVIGKDAYDKVKPHVDKALSGSTNSFENWIPYAGKKRFISANYIPHVDNNNRVLGYIALINDLTERKHFEEAIIEKEERLRLIINGVGAGTFEFDLGLNDIKVSDELKVLLGVSKDLRIDARVAQSLVHPDDLSLLLQQLSDIKSSGSDGYMAVDYRIIKNDSEEVRWLHTRSKVLFVEQQGKQIPSRIIGVSIDITDRKVWEEKLKEFNHNLEESIHERTAQLMDVNRRLTERNDELNKAQAVLQQLIDSSPELIVVIDRDLKFLAVNKPFEDFVNKPRTGLIGKEIFEAYGGARGTPQVLLLERVLKGERIHLKANPSIARPNIWFDSHYVPLVINGNIEGAIILSRDITDIVKSERELADVNRQLREAQHLSKLGSWEWDLGTGTVIWSDEMYRIYGYEEKFPVDFVKATERMSPEDAERSSRRTQQHIQEALDRFKKTGELVYEISSIEFPIQLPTGEKKLLRSSGKFQLTPEGKLHRLIGTLQDVTQIRLTEAKLRQVIDELETKNKELESFTYVASHDLKEPLRKIQTLIDRIRTKGSNDLSNSLLKIDDAAKRMTHLIESILTLGQVSNAELDFVNVDLNKVVDSCRSDLEIRMKETNAEILTDSLPVVRGSELQMIQVFSNLLANSLKFCETTPNVRISCDKVSAPAIGKADPLTNREYWRIKFSDNGIGFDPEYKEQIFEPFQRLHRRDEYKGTGIGLSIVKKIIERHQGFIDVESEKGKGTTFVILLPII